MVIRYGPDYDLPNYPEPDGDYVLYDDYKKLEDRIAELEAEVSRLHSNGERHHVRYKDDVEYYQETIEALQAELAAHRKAIEKLNRTSVSVEIYDAAVAELTEIKTSYREIMDEPCEGSDDRVHCTCVPVLRYRIAKLETAIRLAAEEPNIDKARAIADEILMPKANAPAR